jgi:hypothetical protein
MAGGIDDGKMIFKGLELTIRDIDGNTSLSLTF